MTSEHRLSKDRTFKVKDDKDPTVIDGYRSALEVFRDRELFTIDLITHAKHAEESLKHYLKPAPVGKYLSWDTNPIFTADSTYYAVYTEKDKAGITRDDFAIAPGRHRSGSAPVVGFLAPLRDPFEAVRNGRDILLLDGTVVLRYRDFLRVQKSIVDYPSVSPVAIRLMEAMLNHRIRSKTFGRGVWNPNSPISDCLKESFYESYSDDHLYDYVPFLCEEVDRIVDNHAWNCYFTKLAGTRFLLERSVDYRVYLYYEQKFEELHAKHAGHDI